MALLLTRTVFVHTPKTAGQWTAAALARGCEVQGHLGPVHASPDEINQSVDWRVRPYRITFVRHPLSWYASIWAHRMDESWTPVDDPAWFSGAWIDRWAEFTVRTEHNDFDGFLRQAITAFPDGWVTRLFKAYTAECTGVGRQEHLADDLLKLLQEAGEHVDVHLLMDTPEHNTRASTPARRLQTTVDQGLVESVMQVENWVVNRFGYHELPRWVTRQWPG